MNLLRRDRGPDRPRVFLLGLDGVPYSYLRAETAAGRLPNLAALFAEGSLAPMRSSLPTVSSTAWTSFFTGRDAGGHGVFGFMDCKPDSHEFYFPNLEHVAAPALWDVLQESGLRSVIVNVPGTYPARPVDGALVSGFVAPSIDRAVYPPELLPRLREMGYRVDLDAAASRASFEALERDLFETFGRRKDAIRMLLAEEAWDLFVAVVTETDRLYHFQWNHMEAEVPEVVDLFHRFHAAIDDFVGWLVESLPASSQLLLMSDHGFATERVDVNTNAWLKERGYLAFDEGGGKDLSAISPRSSVYSLAPGRFYVNRVGPRPRGSVPPERVGPVLDGLISDLSDLRDPETGELVYGDLLLRDDVYHGPQAARGPDVILTFKPGYELKASASGASVFGAPAEGLAGMHTYDDAHFYIRDEELRDGPLELHDVAATVAHLLGVEGTPFSGVSMIPRRDLQEAT